MALTWPAALPDVALKEGFSLKLAKQVVSTPTDRGRPLVRRKSSARLEPMAQVMMMTEAQKDQFFEFYYDSTAGGALAFDYASPAHGGALILFMFHPDQQPDIQKSGGEWRVAFTLLRTA